MRLPSNTKAAPADDHSPRSLIRLMGLSWMLHSVQMYSDNMATGEAVQHYSTLLRLLRCVS
jgi:hypothetical protein